FTFMLGQWASGVAMPLLVVSLGGSLAEAGIIAAIRFGLGAIFSLPFGAVADAWGTRRTLAVAVAANATTNLVPIGAVASGSLLPLYAWAILSGLAASLFLPANGAYVAGTASPESRGSAFGWLTLATHTGVASGPAIGGILWEQTSPAITFLASSLLGATALVAPVFVAASIRTQVDLSGLPRMVAGVARDRVIVGSWLAALGIGLPWGAVSGLFPLFAGSIGIAAGSAGLLLGLQSIANGASRVPLGRLIDRRAVPPLVAAGTCAIYGGATALLGLQSGPLGIALIFVGGIMALAFTLMVVQVTISARAPAELRATGLGGYSTFLSAGLGVGPFIAGTAAEAGGFGIGFASVAGLGIAVALLAAILLRGARAGSRPPAV
ncbi:MAG TPA: MFS transporter, partial [Candidatus Limnocylindrales bacterium]|nr:MFS transporter [Candidatus Limnocylindrales bacterium]